MRYLRQNTPPASLEPWKVQRRSARQELNYDELGPGIARDIRQQRIQDQGGLCAYTMRRIDLASSHVEHLVPREDCKASGRVEETVDYGNMVACFPGDDAPAPGYGATYRGSKPLPLTPRDASCETRLRYRLKGTVEPVNGDADAARTIAVLNLNHGTLQDMRRSAFKEAGLDGGNLNGKASALALKNLHQQSGTLTPFCVAISQAVDEHVARLEKKAARRKRIHAAQKR